MPVRKLHGSWWVDFQFNQTRYRKRSPENSKTGAELYEGLLRRELAVHGRLDGVLGSKGQKPQELIPTFSDFSERWHRDYVMSNNKPSEQKQKRYILKAHLVPVFGRVRTSKKSCAMNWANFSSSKPNSGQ